MLKGQINGISLKIILFDCHSRQVRIKGLMKKYF